MLITAVHDNFEALYLDDWRISARVVGLECIFHNIHLVCGKLLSFGSRC